MHGKGWGWNGNEREIQFTVGRFDMVPLGRPVGTDRVAVKTLNQRIDRCIIDAQYPIAPRRNKSFRFEYPAHLSIEPIKVEPVQRLGDHNKIRAAITETAVFCQGNPVFNSGMLNGLGDLPRAGIGRDNMPEVSGKSRGDLTTASTTVPGKLMGAALTREPLKKPWRVAGTTLGVVCCNRTKVILEAFSHRWS